MTRLVGFDLGAPRITAVAFDRGAPETLLDGEQPLGDAGVGGRALLDLVGAAASSRVLLTWCDLAPADVEAVAESALRGVRGRVAEDGAERCEAAVAMPACLDDVRRDLLCHAARAAGFETAQPLTCAEAAATAGGARDLPGATVVLCAGRGHLEAGLFEGRDGELVAHGERSVAVARGDPVVDNVASWLAFTWGRQHRGERLDGPRSAGPFLDAVARALDASVPGAAFVVKAPAEGAPELRVDPEVVELALDDVAERLAAIVADLLAVTALDPRRVARLAVAGRLARFEAVATRVARRLGVERVDLGPAAVALGCALAARPQGSPRSPDEGSRVEVLPLFDEGDGDDPSAPVAPPLAALPAPDRGPTAPSSAPGATLPRRGSFTSARRAAELLALPLAHAATAAQLARPLALPALLAQVGMRPAFEGTLVLRGGGDEVRLGLAGAQPLTSPGERPKALRCFEWEGGTYEVMPDPPHGHAHLTAEPMTAFVVAGLRPLLRELGEADVLAALGGRASLAPTVRPGRDAKVSRMGLTAAEQRAVAHTLDPSASLAALLDAAAMSRGTTARLVFLLELFDVLAWAPPPAHGPADARAELARRVGAMRGQNHFEALGVHWSANGEEVSGAWRHAREDYGPAGPWARVDAGLAAEALERARAAWAALSDDASRVRYRREAYPTLDQELLAPLVQGRAQALAMANERGEADDMLRLLREMGGAPPAPDGKR